jgi:hypothetical protein
MVDMEAIHTFEGTETMQTLIVGRAITGRYFPASVWKRDSPSAWR